MCFDFDMKRLLDIVLIVLSAPLWIPLMAVVSVVLLAFQGLPLLFVDMRAGKDGREFRMFKFRTMRNGIGNDASRLTSIGRIVRRTSLDELPEIWNVLVGDMSLVGPRPLPIRYLSRYTPEQNRRHEVMPGITGWAQVNGRNLLDWEDKFRYDVDYVDNHSLWLDLKIIAMTILQVIVPRGINHDGEATMAEFEG